jgi:spermidine synthase
LSKFYPRLAAGTPGSPASGASAATLLLFAVSGITLGVATLGRRRLDLRLVLLVVMAGAAGMLLETALVLRFQIVNGIVFQDVGLLLASFMAGLAAGAWAIDAVRLQTRPGPVVRRWGRAIALSLGLLSLAASRVAVQSEGWAIPGAMLCAAGALVGGAFGYATSRWPRDPARGLGALYAADLAGGCAGTVIAALVLVPQAGLDVTALGSAVLAALTLLLI